MTTTVKVHVNGNYRTTIEHKVDGEPQPTMTVGPNEEKQLHFVHGKTNEFTASEEYLGEKPAS